MFKSFVAWLDSYITEEGLPAALKAVVGLLGFAGLLGTLFGSLPIRAGACAAVALSVLVAVTAIWRDRRELLREHEEDRKLARALHRPHPAGA